MPSRLLLLRTKVLKLINDDHDGGKVPIVIHYNLKVSQKKWWLSHLPYILLKKRAKVSRLTKEDHEGGNVPIGKDNHIFYLSRAKKLLVLEHTNKIIKVPVKLFWENSK